MGVASAATVGTDPGAATGATGVSVAGVTASAPAADFAAAFAASVVDPSVSPAGVNVPCALTAAHPYPVVLVHGTFLTMESSFGNLGPALAATGRCVYGYNYGGPAVSPVQALAPVPDGVQSLANEVATVQQQTGASKVDLVGYSQGGLISEIYTKNTGGRTVHSVTALAPPTHGTTLLGLATLARQVPGALAVVSAAGCPACSDQTVGSPVITGLNTGPVAVRGIPYTVIDTVLEDVVTPAGTASFISEPGVVNQFVQSYALVDANEHVTLPFDPVAIDLVKKALVRAKS